ncbi:MAG: SDR family oxidoreductase [Emcibacteraceae bacterium]|nr:SDR family oxidoreductase [Emcibacteraceae bacterium]
MTQITSQINLDGAYAIITGANRGIGKQISETFQAAGAHVFACTRELNSDFMDWVETQKQSGTGDVTPIQLDLTDDQSLKSAINDIRMVSSKIDILVNSAGVAHGSLFQMTPISDIKTVFDVNFFGQIALSQSVSRLMARNKSGSIINISSSTAHIVDPGTLAYGTSKAALNRATKSMAIELGEMGIRVNAISPGVTNTEMSAQMDDNARSMLIASSVLKKAASPQDIANTAIFLASDLSSHITGQIICVDGGIV